MNKTAMNMFVLLSLYAVKIYDLTYITGTANNHFGLQCLSRSQKNSRDIIWPSQMHQPIFPLFQKFCERNLLFFGLKCISTSQVIS